MAETDDDPEYERTLLRGVAEGDRGAFETFYRRYERRVYRYACRLVDDDAAAAEVTADVMLEIWRGAGRYRGAARPSTWVLGIAHHKAVDRLRRRQPNLVELRLAERPDPATEPERCAIASATRDAISAAFATLSPEHRSVLHLTFVLGYGQSEIAEVSGIPLGTVKTRVYYAKRALRAALTAAGLQREVS
jgi:RNA polymerase sigma-70 factor (ECF subfamily)